MTISKDRVKPSPLPDSWKLSEIFATGVILGTYLAVMTVIFFWIIFETNFFPNHFHVKHIRTNPHAKEMFASAVYLQVSTISQALIFVTRSRGWSYTERPGLLLVIAFVIAQLVLLVSNLVALFKLDYKIKWTFLCGKPYYLISLYSQVATCISAYANWNIAGIRGIGMGWAAVIWLFNIVTYVFLDPLKFAVAYQQSGRAWNLVVNQRTAFTNKNDFGKESREAAWAAEQRTLHGLRSAESKGFAEKHNHREINTMADEAKRRAELARLRELHTLKGRVESFARLRGLDVETMNGHYTV